MNELCTLLRSQIIVTRLVRVPLDLPVSVDSYNTVHDKNIAVHWILSFPMLALSDKSSQFIHKILTNINLKNHFYLLATWAFAVWMIR
jgi:aspartyl-tRNA synthetase